MQGFISSSASLYNQHFTIMVDRGWMIEIDMPFYVFISTYVLIKFGKKRLDVKRLNQIILPRCMYVTMIVRLVIQKYFKFFLLKINAKRFRPTLRYLITNFSHFTSQILFNTVKTSNFLLQKNYGTVWCFRILE